MKLSMPVIVLLISSICWGLIWLPLQFFEAQGLNGPPMVFIIFLSAVLVLLPIVYHQRQRWAGQLRHMALIVLFGGFTNLLMQNAMFYGDVVRVMILFYMLPVWSVFGGRFFLGEKIDTLRWLTLAAAICGGILIMGGFKIFTATPSGLDLMAIGAGFAFAMNNLVFRVSQVIPLASKVGAMLFGVVLFMALYLLITPTVVWPTDSSIISYAGLYGILWIIPISFGTQWGVTLLEAGRASIIIVMELVAAVISTVLILGDVLSLIEITGAGLMITAVILEGFRQDAETADRTPVLAPTLSDPE